MLKKIEELFKEAQNYLSKNDLINAKITYNDILNKQPNSYMALSMLGIIASNEDGPEKALIYFNEAIFINPMFVDAYYNKGVALQELKLYKESLENYKFALFLNPNLVEAYINSGNIFQELKEYENALNSYNLAISINKNNAIAYYNKGNVFNETGKLEKAIENYNIAIKINPSYAEAYCNKGLILKDMMLYEQAIESLQISTAINPNLFEAYYNQGKIFEQQLKFAEAINRFETTVKINPNYVDAYISLGNIYFEIGLYDKSILALDKGIEIDGKSYIAYMNKGNILSKLNKFQEAILNFDRAIEIKPDYAKSKYNKSSMLLSKNIFKEGWELYGSRWALVDPPLETFVTSKPIVKNLHEVLNKKILIWHEQGIGDFVIFSGLLEEMAKLAPNIQILVDPRFLSLYRRSMPHLKFIDKGVAESKLEFDVHMPIGDLAKYFRNSVNDFDLSRKGYLISDPNKTKQIKDLLTRDKKYICGLSWKSKREKLGKSKSIDLTDLLPILKNKNITFVSLQYGDVAEELKSLYEKHDVLIHENKMIDHFNDLDGHTSMIDACDFVISISSSTAHIAGALGKETYLLPPLGFAAIWYWSNEINNKSIWYPSISIFQKTIGNDWQEPIQLIKRLLDNKINDLNSY